VCVWDLASGEAAATFRYQPAECPDWMFPAVAYSPDGRLLLTGGYAGGGATFWDADTGMPQGAPLRHSGQPDIFAEGVAFSPDGRRALTGNSNWDAQIWDVAARRPVGPPVRTGGRNFCAAFSPDGKTFLTGHL